MSKQSSMQDEESCESCGLVLDVAAERLFALVKCPRCEAVFRVRKQINGYEFLDVLGRGGSGRVLKARNLHTHEEIALKVLEKSHPEYQEVLLFLKNEASFAKVLHHPSILRVLGLDQDEYGARLAMELMEGGSLHDWMTSEVRPNEHQILQTGLQISKALSAAYEQGIIHRDLKPANILFTASGEPKLADFGLARNIFSGKNEEGELTIEKHIMATPDYVAPEVLEGQEGDFRSDIYALGGTLFHAFTGGPPFPTDELSLEELQTIKRKHATISSIKNDLSTATVALIDKMLTPKIESRFSSYREVILAFERALNEAERKSNAGAQATRKQGGLKEVFPVGKK